MVLRAGSGRANGKESPGRTPERVLPGLPNLRGDFDELMDHRPIFRIRMQGYDRLEVDNYTAWAEGELVTLRREVDHLLSRFAETSAELEISRRLLADAPPGREAYPVSKRVQEMLRLAEDEAAAITEAGAQEAEQMVAEARAEADARLRKAHEIKQMAVQAADEILEHARRDRAAAAAAVERSRTQAAEILREAAAERDRLAAQAAGEREQAARAATAHLATVQAEVDDLRRQREQVRQSLRGLADRVGEALQAVADMAPEDAPRTHVLQGNVAVEGMEQDDREDRDETDVVVMMGRPAPFPH
jgi:cell division septum initiation protein DivIVA